MVDWESYIAGAVLGFGIGGLVASIAWKQIHRMACWRADHWQRMYRMACGRADHSDLRYWEEKKRDA